MKIIIFAFSFLCATAVFGQSAPVLSNNVQQLSVPDHVEHASQHEMATETSLLASPISAYTYGQGEQPVWQFGTEKREVPLGDVARAYRKGHTVDRKATVVVDNN